MCQKESPKVSLCAAKYYPCEVQMLGSDFLGEPCTTRGTWHMGSLVGEMSLAGAVSHKLSQGTVEVSKDALPGTQSTPLSLTQETPLPSHSSHSRPKGEEA